MDETELRSLIAAGENESVEFKREINLNSAEKKAEFIKDILALANSYKIKGYLLVGVEDDGVITGSQKLDEERIQQIIHTYINPPIIIKIDEIIQNLEVSFTVSAIQVASKSRPYKVIKDIDRIHKDDVFVRHGTVVFKASPEEIIEMNNYANKVSLEITEDIQKADSHMKIGNYLAAIKKYSKIIDEYPTPEMLLLRGQAYKAMADKLSHNSIGEEWGNYVEDYSKYATLAYEDFSNLLKLNPEKSQEKQTRLERIKLKHAETLDVYSDDDNYKDLQWFRVNTGGYELAEAIYTYIESKYFDTSFVNIPEGEEIVNLVDQVLHLGYIYPKVYYYRALGNKLAGNFGNALRDIDTALKGSDLKTIERFEHLCFRALILNHLGKFNDVYNTLSEARNMSDRYRKIDNFYRIHHNPLATYLYNCGIEKEFINKPSKTLWDGVIIMLMLLNSKVNLFKNDRGEICLVMSELDMIASSHKQIIKPLISLIKPELWDMLGKGEKNTIVKITIPGYK